MDLDDVVKALLPKSMRKKAKKRLKKLSLTDIVEDFFKMVLAFFSKPKKTAVPQKTKATVARTAKAAERPKTDDPLQDAILQAHAYQQNIASMAQAAQADSMAKIRLEQLNSRVADWVLIIEKIATHVQSQNEDRLLAEERKRVPAAIKRLEKQLKNTEDATLRHKLKLTLNNRQKQLAQLEQSSRNRQMAELKVENTLAQLGIIYSQLHSNHFMTQTSNYDRLSTEINEQVLTLRDYLDTLHMIRQDTTTWN